MANELLLKTKTQIVFRDSTDFGPAAANDLRQGTPTLVQLALASVADDAARQSAKFDLGALRPPEYTVMAALELAATGLTAGEVVQFYVAWSPDPVAANGNPGGVSGSDAAYTGYSSNLDDSLKQLQHVGNFVVTGQATGTVQIVTDAGVFVPRARHGSLIVVDRSGAALHSDDVEMHVLFDPIVDEIQ